MNTRKINCITLPKLSKNLSMQEEAKGKRITSFNLNIKDLQEVSKEAVKLDLSLSQYVGKLIRKDLNRLRKKNGIFTTS